MQHAVTPDPQKNKARTYTVQRLNDLFRQTLCGGRVLLTSGVLALSADAVDGVLQAVRNFSTFDRANDPYDEHDFGFIERDAVLVFWKIDYYDLELEFASPEPSDPSITTRVLTIMLASEY